MIFKLQKKIRFGFGFDEKLFRNKRGRFTFLFDRVLSERIIVFDGREIVGQNLFAEIDITFVEVR